MYEVLVNNDLHKGFMQEKQILENVAKQNY
jgi:hypothetical protein